MGIQQPGQSKEQTKLVARGIEKGIAQYKKRYSAKERELNKALNRQRTRAAQDEERVDTAPATSGQMDMPHQSVRPRQCWLPWTLLLLSWAAFAVLVSWWLRGAP